MLHVIVKLDTLEMIVQLALAQINVQVVMDFVLIGHVFVILDLWEMIVHF